MQRGLTLKLVFHPEALAFGALRVREPPLVQRVLSQSGQPMVSAEAGAGRPWRRLPLHVHPWMPRRRTAKPSGLVSHGGHQVVSDAQGPPVLSGQTPWAPSLPGGRRLCASDVARLGTRPCSNSNFRSQDVSSWGLSLRASADSSFNSSLSPLIMKSIR